MSSGSASMTSTSASSTPAASRAARRLKCDVEASGVAMVRPARSSTDSAPDSGFTTRASASPMTSWIHGTW